MLRNSVHKSVGRRFASSTAVRTTSSDGGLALSQLKLVVKGGARAEPAPGVAHLLALFAFRDTRTRSALRLTRESELLGGSFWATPGRESITLNTRFLREDLPYFVETLALSLDSLAFKPHEFVEEVLPLARAEAARARASPVYVALENAYQVAFRRGLGNQVLLPVGASPTLDQVRDYAAEVFARDNVELAAQGVSETDLSEFVNKSFARVAETATALAAPATSGVFGGDIRVQQAATGEHVAVLAYASKNAAPELELLRLALDSKPVKWTSGTGLLNKALAQEAVDVTVRNNTFYDANLFTVVLSGADSAVVGNAARTAAATIAEVAAGKASADVAARALAQARLARAAAQDSGAVAVSNAAAEIPAGADLAAIAKSLLKSKPVLSVVGNVRDMPYADEL